MEVRLVDLKRKRQKKVRRNNALFVQKKNK